MSHVNQNYIATRQEAREIIDQHGDFWVCNCACREARNRCGRSRHDVCFAFHPENVGGAGHRKITRAEVEEILREAETKHLVMRPYLDEARVEVRGFCVCCDDCCACFLEPEKYPSDKGAYLESTDRALCSECGDCAAVCYFGARKMADGELAVERDACFGCGLCADVCPAGCIAMVAR